MRWILLGVALAAVGAAADRPESIADEMNMNGKDLQFTEFKLFAAPLMMQPCYKKDIYLAKYFRRYNYDVAAAKAAVQSDLAWRLQNKMDVILTEDFTDLSTGEYAASVTFEDKLHRPIIASPGGKWDITRGVVAQNLKDRLSRFTYWMLETAVQKALDGSASRTAAKYNMFIDYSGFTAASGACVVCVSTLADVAANLDTRWPNMIYEIYLVNAPDEIKIIIDTVKPLLNPESQPHMKVFGADEKTWRPVINQVIDDDVIDQILLTGSGGLTSAWELALPADKAPGFAAWKATAILGITADWMKTDQALVKIYRKANYDSTAAGLALSGNNDWRKSKNIDAITTEDFSAMMKGAYPANVDMVDMNGRPIIFSHGGKWDVNAGINAGMTEKLTRLGYYLIETAAKKTIMAAAGGAKYSTYTIFVDYAGWDLAKGGCVGCLSIVADIGGNLDLRWPRMIYKIIVVNAPDTLNVLIQTIKPLLDKATQDNFHVFDTNMDKWKKFITTVIMSEADFNKMW